MSTKGWVIAGVAFVGLCWLGSGSDDDESSEEIEGQGDYIEVCDHCGKKFRTTVQNSSLCPTCMFNDKVERGDYKDATTPIEHY